MEPNREVDVARNVGLGDITFFSQVGYGGGAGCGTIVHAAMAIATGQADVVVAWRARKRADKASRPWAQVAERLEDHFQWSRPWGLLRPVDEIAMLTRRYMHEYGATREHLANVAVAFRKHANRNPAATMYERPLTREQYLDARWISEPLCLFDNCLETDGGLAVVLVSAERAKDLPTKPVYLHTGRAGPAAAAPDDDQLLQRRPAARAGVDGGEAPVARRRLHARRREGRPDLRRVQPARSRSRSRATGSAGAVRARPSPRTATLEWPNGRLPTNTSGGGMSEAYVHGFNLVLEGVRQMPRHVDEPGRGRGVVPRDERRGCADQRHPLAELKRCADDGRPGLGIPAPRPRGRGRRALLGGHRARRAARPGVRQLRAPAVPTAPDVPVLPVARDEVGADVGPGHRVVVRGPPPAAAPGLRRARALQRDRRRARRGPDAAHVGNLVTGPDGPINEIDPATITIGEPVEVVFSQVDDITLPRWKRVER